MHHIWWIGTGNRKEVWKVEIFEVSGECLCHVIPSVMEVTKRTDYFRSAAHPWLLIVLVKQMLSQLAEKC